MSFFRRIVGYFQNILNRLTLRLNQQKYRAKLTLLPGIGSKNVQRFFDAGFITPEQILRASDEALLAIPGVGRSFLKRLREYR